MKKYMPVNKFIMKKQYLKNILLIIFSISLTSCSYFIKDKKEPISFKDIYLKKDNVFKWGVATSGYQIEGDSKPSVWSERDLKKGVDSQTYGNNFRKYSEEWIKLAKDLNVNSFRLSIEWSRVQPRKPTLNDSGFDENEIAFYKKLISDLKRKNNIDPLVTLVHFNYPKWLDEETKSKGLLDPKFKDYYLKYVEKMSQEMGQDVTYWITFNEPNVWLVACYYKNTFPPFYGKENIADLLEADIRLNDIHKEAYKKIHSIYKEKGFNDPKVSMNFYHMPKPKFSLEGITDPFVSIAPLINIDPSFPGLGFLSIPNHNYMDFVAIDYYFRFNSTNDLDTHHEFWSKEIYPQGLYDAIMYYAKSKDFKDKEIIIAENGFATKNGENMQVMSREEHLLIHLKEIFRAKEDGAKVTGYYYWTLMDNYEWGSYEPRFGLYHIPNIGNNIKIKNIEDIFKDICPTKAAFVYRNIINDISLYDQKIENGFLPNKKPKDLIDFNLSNINNLNSSIRTCN